MTENTDSTQMLASFDSPDEYEHWFSVNDVVMGGLSSGHILIEDDSIANFTGILSLENNGGFASVRTRPQPWSLDEYTGIRLRVKGDGRTYQFRLRTDDEFDGVAYKLEFPTPKDKWISIDLPFADFQGSYRGRILPDVGSPDPARVRQIGFLIADKTPGRFSLLVDTIEAYR